MKIKIRIRPSPGSYYMMIFYRCGGNFLVEHYRFYISVNGTALRSFEYLTSAKSIRTIQKIKKMENEIRKMKESL